MKRIPSRASRTRLKKSAFFLLTILCFLSVFFSFGCKKQTDYFSYVSELRSNVLIAETEGYSLKIFAVKRETPYVADGIPRALSTTAEFHLTAPQGVLTANLSFTIDGKEYGGEASYDNVKSELYYSQGLDLSEAQTLTVLITAEEKTYELEAVSVRTASTLTPKALLSSIVKTEKEYFTQNTDKYGFKGEIYVRLIYEDNAYYYVGVVGRDERTLAFLVNAENGKILAKRES